MERVLKQINIDIKHKKRQIDKLKEERHNLLTRLEAIESEYLPAELELLDEFEQVRDMIERKANHDIFGDE